MEPRDEPSDRRLPRRETGYNIGLGLIGAVPALIGAATLNPIGAIVGTPLGVVAVPVVAYLVPSPEKRAGARRAADLEAKLQRAFEPETSTDRRRRVAASRTRRPLSRGSLSLPVDVAWTRHQLSGWPSGAW